MNAEAAVQSAPSGDAKEEVATPHFPLTLEEALAATRPPEPQGSHTNEPSGYTAASTDTPATVVPTTLAKVTNSDTLTCEANSDADLLAFVHLLHGPTGDPFSRAAGPTAV